MGGFIRIGDEKAQGRAYLAASESGPGPRVLVFHAWWGFNDFFKKLCDRLCGEGFVVLGPDYFLGKVASTID